MAYLDQMYSGMQPKRTAPTGGSWPGGQMTGMMDWATPEQGRPEVSYGSEMNPTMGGAAPYTPKKGKWVSMAGVTEPGIGGTAEQGYWTADPNVDYGQAPEAGMGQFFDQQGNFAGWTSGRTGSSGSGLFGDFGDVKTAKQYHIDPATGKLMDPTTQTHTPSVSGGTKFMSYAMPIAMMAGLGAGAAGGAFSGAAAGTGAAPSGASWGLTGGSFGTGGAATAADVAAALGTGGSAAGAGGLSLEAASYLPEAAEAVSGIGANAPLYGGTNGTAAFSGLSSISQIKELVGQGMSVMDAINMVGGGGQGGPGGTQRTGTGGNSLLDLLGAYYSSQQMKDYSGNMKSIYSDLNKRQDQFRDPLLSSYQDPNTFFNSNQWKGLESVYQNSIDRDAAKAGRLGNPTDREVLLQSHAMKELENFRKGLRDSAMMTRPEAALDPLAKGYQAEAYANTAPWATIGRGGTGSGNPVQDVIGAIGDGVSTAEDIWKFISGFFD